MNDDAAVGQQQQQPARKPWWKDVESRSTRLVVLALPLILLGIFAVKRRWMDDDGFINLRVVENLMAGRGPVYNVGERVEVGTSPLWIALLALLGTLHVRLEYLAVWLGIGLTLGGVAAGMAGSVAVDPRERSVTSYRLTIPLGALTLAVLPPVWEYASSGLETGLTFAWLGVSFALLVHALQPRDLPRRRGSLALTAMALGLGPLVRPEAALYSAAMLVPLALGLAPARGQRDADDAVSTFARVRFVAGLAVAAMALPVAYQIFRMGYYGALAPNTSIAKESTLTYWKQGYCYAQNFFGRYRLGWPLLLAAGFLFFRVREVLRARKRALASVLVLLPLAAAVHALYIVRVGGDYMHARMFLPVMFAALLPVFSVSLDLDRPRQAIVEGIFALAIVPWWILCGAYLRVPRENQCGIGDEHGWYVRESKVAHPIRVGDYSRHDFGKLGRDLVAKVNGGCPDHTRCRQLFFGERDHGNLFPWRGQMPVAPDLDPRVQAVVTATAIGIIGYQLPLDVHVVDQLGLADPVAARIQLKERARPGHEKDMGNAWVVALFGQPLPDDDVSVKAARRALACGPLAELVQATRGPLTTSGFFANLRHSFELQTLRIPPDPFDAEAKMCGVHVPDVSTVGGTGGVTYRWQCPEGGSVVSISGAIDLAPKSGGDKPREGPERVIYVRPRCALPADASGRAVTREGPLLGKEHESNFELACPPSSVAVGLTGRASDKIEELALSCAKVDASGALGEVVHTGTIGGGEEDDFDLKCGPNERMVGLLGRSGDWLDALGPVCDTVKPPVH